MIMLPPTFSISIMNNFQPALLSFAFILLAVSGSLAQSAKAREINSLMSAEHQLGIFNGSILVVKNGRIVYRSEFGYSDSGGKTKLTSDYRFNIGSIAKEFNAVGIMMLKEQGKLALDDKVSKYLNFLPPWAERISVRNLLQYTSGLPDINWKTVKSDDDILSDLKALKELNSEPGTKYAYNNTNVFLQRRIIEEISSISFQKFVETRMLKPCEMTESVVDPDLRGKNIAVSFNNDFVEDTRQFSIPMSGWTAVTAKDLYKWTRCLHNFRLINKSSFREILEPFAANKQSGLGGGSMAGDVIKEHIHDGQSLDFEALMYSAPSEDTAIILLTNNKNFKLYEIKDAVKSILDGTAYKIPKKSLFAALNKKAAVLSGKEIISLYNELKSKQPKDFDFESESELNRLGYSLMGSQRIDDAIEIFELNVRTFPNSANAYDSLGEAYFNKGDKKSALFNYKKSLELNPNNAGAKEIIGKIEKEK